MSLAAPLLAFLSVTLLILWFGFRKGNIARRRVQRELVEQTIRELREQEEINEQTLLRDESMSGFSSFNTLLAKLRLAGNLQRLINQADLNMRVGTLLLLTVVMGIVGYMGGHFGHAGWALSMAIGLMMASVPYTYVRVVRSRRFRRFETLFPEAVDLMSRAIRAGHAFSTGIKMVADELPNPVGKEFRRVFEEQNLGLPLRNALMGLLDRVDLVDLKLFVVAVLVQRQSGGNLSEILDKIAYTIRERFRILRQLRVHTAQGRLTGIILTALPPVMGAVIYWLNYDYMKIILERDLGIYILTGAALLQLAGFIWIRKIVNIEV